MSVTHQGFRGLVRPHDESVRSEIDLFTGEMCLSGCFIWSEAIALSFIPKHPRDPSLKKVNFQNPSINSKTILCFFCFKYLSKFQSAGISPYDSMRTILFLWKEW